MRRVVLFDTTSIRDVVETVKDKIKENSWRGDGIKYKKKPSDNSNKDTGNLNNLVSWIDVKDADEKNIENEVFKAWITTLLEEQNSKMNQVDERLQQLEARMDHLLHKLHVHVPELNCAVLFGKGAINNVFPKIQSSK